MRGEAPGRGPKAFRRAGPRPLRICSAQGASGGGRAPNARALASLPPRLPLTPAPPAHPQARSGVMTRAAAEEVKTASANGAPLKPATAAMDFDELTELIK